jgi:Fe-S cluster assembly protein SufD
MATTEKETHAAVTDLAAHQATLTGPSWLQRLREQARKKFETSSWPTTSEEEWRRTNLSPFEFEVYETAVPDPAQATQTSGTVTSDVPRAALLRYSGDSLVSAQISEDVAGKGVVAADIGAVPEDSPAHTAAKDALTSLLEKADNRLQFWNLALASAIPVVYVPRNVTVDAPVEIHFSSGGDEVISAPLVVVIAEEGSSATVIRRFETEDEEGELLVVDGQSVTVGANASLKFVDLQRLNDESLYFGNGVGYLARDARLHRTELSLGSDFVKTRFESVLTGPGSDAILNGIYFAEDEQHMDIRTVQKHAAPNALSRAFYRGAVRDESHAIYQGLIDVAAKAPGTDAYLTNKNLILTEEARADSIPSLNIKTDDVRCSHGSTTGKLDEKQIYYLQTRGYNKREAKRALVEGYFEDLVVQVPEDLHDEIRELIKQRIP